MWGFVSKAGKAREEWSSISLDKKNRRRAVAQPDAGWVGTLKRSSAPFKHATACGAYQNAACQPTGRFGRRDRRDSPISNPVVVHEPKPMNRANLSRTLKKHTAHSRFGYPFANPALISS